jgi:hypothetical protein
VPEADLAVLTPSELATGTPLHAPFLPEVATPSVTDERAARAALRNQIARLERELGAAFVAAFPMLGVDVSVPAAARGPRVLTLGELECLRDALVDKLAEAREELAHQHEVQARNRALLEQVRLDPGRYKYFRIASSDLGEFGCGEYRVRPRRGLVGMLAGWWQVKLSSGCPLAGGFADGEARTVELRDRRTLKLR